MFDKPQGAPFLFGSILGLVCLFIFTVLYFVLCERATGVVDNSARFADGKDVGATESDRKTLINRSSSSSAEIGKRSLPIQSWEH